MVTMVITFTQHQLEKQVWTDPRLTMPRLFSLL